MHLCLSPFYITPTGIYDPSCELQKENEGCSEEASKRGGRRVQNREIYTRAYCTQGIVTWPLLPDEPYYDYCYEKRSTKRLIYVLVPHVLKGYIFSRSFSCFSSYFKVLGRKCCSSVRWFHKNAMGFNSTVITYVICSKIWCERSVTRNKKKGRCIWQGGWKYKRISKGKK